MKNSNRCLLALIAALAILPATVLAFPAGPPPVAAPPAAATRPAVVGGFIAGAQPLAAGQIGLNYEHAKFEATFDFPGYRFTPPKMPISTYDLFGAVTDKLVVGFGASGGEIIDTYGKYSLDKNLDLLFGKKQDDKHSDIYAQYKFPFPITLFAGTRQFANSPVSTVDTAARLVCGASAFLPLSRTAGLHGMVAATNKSREWQLGLDKRIDKNLSLSLQYRTYRENGDNDAVFRLKGLGLDLNYLF